jgi:hypothetical protein
MGSGTVGIEVRDGRRGKGLRTKGRGRANSDKNNSPSPLINKNY